MGSNYVLILGYVLLGLAIIIAISIYIITRHRRRKK
jgi:hypothetical protein